MAGSFRPSSQPCRQSLYGIMWCVLACTSPTLDLSPSSLKSDNFLKFTPDNTTSVSPASHYSFTVRCCDS